jgi:hypothetical protein
MNACPRGRFASANRRLPLCKIHLAKPAQQVYYRRVKLTKKLKQQLRQELNRELASAGGKARAEKYDKKTLSKWGKRGGRPRKSKEGAR